MGAANRSVLGDVVDAAVLHAEMISGVATFNHVNARGSGIRRNGVWTFFGLAAGLHLQASRETDRSLAARDGVSGENYLGVNRILQAIFRLGSFVFGFLVFGCP